MKPPHVFPPPAVFAGAFASCHAVAAQRLLDAGAEVDASVQQALLKDDAAVWKRFCLDGACRDLALRLVGAARAAAPGDGAAVAAVAAAGGEETFRTRARAAAAAADEAAQRRRADAARALGPSALEGALEAFDLELLGSLLERGAVCSDALLAQLLASGASDRGEDAGTTPWRVPRAPALACPEPLGDQRSDEAPPPLLLSPPISYYFSLHFFHPFFYHPLAAPIFHVRFFLTCPLCPLFPRIFFFF